MPELVAITTDAPSRKRTVVASNAATALEQYFLKRDSPYWDVVPATTTTPTVTAVQSAGSPGKLTEESVIVRELSTDDGQALVEEFLQQTTELAQEELDTFGNAITDIAESVNTGDHGESGTPQSLIKQIAGDPELTTELFSNDDFIWTAARIGNPFGPIYRVFDFTTVNHGHPIRSREALTEIEDQYREMRETVYAVKLLARD